MYFTLIIKNPGNELSRIFEALYCLQAVSLTLCYDYFIYDFSVLCVLKIVTSIRNPDFRPSCSCLFIPLIGSLLCLQAVSLTFYGGITITTSSRQPPSGWPSCAGRYRPLLPVRRVFPALPPRRPSVRRSCLHPLQYAYGVR